MSKHMMESEENKFKTIFNSIPAVMCIVDEAVMLTEANNAALSLFGKDRERVIGKKIGDMLCCKEIFKEERGCGYGPECQYCEFRRAVSLALEGMPVLSIECPKTVVTGNKETMFWFSINAWPIMVDGKSYAVLSLLDITDRKQKEISVTKTRDFYLRIFENFPTIIWRNNIQGKAEYINENWYTLTGQNIGAALGYGWLERVHSDDRTKFFHSQGKAIDKGEFAEGEMRVLDRSGQYRWLHYANKLYYAMDGAPEGYICMGVDITDKKLTAEELRREKEKAEAANKAKSEFLANMSHEIRTPINGIMGMIDLTLLTENDSEHKENLMTAKSCIRSLLNIINDILDFSKLEAGKLSLESIKFNLRDIVDEVIKAHSHRAERKGLTLSYNISVSTPEIIIGDQNRLRQILNNLLDNAIKFTENGGVILSVGSSPAAGDSFELTFSVADNGIGIALYEMDRLFRSFSQVDGSITRHYGGTGLGLAISKQLVEMMGGKIWVESEKGKGSTFYFTISCKAASATEIISEPKTNFFRTMIPMNILLVEDDPINRHVTQKMINEIGHQVDTAESGVKALALWKQKKYDLILMDIHMSEMDGIEVTKRIRESEIGERTPIVAYTAYALAGDKERFLAAGMDEYLSKPIQMTELCAKLELFSLYKKRAEFSFDNWQINENGDVILIETQADIVKEDSTIPTDILDYVERIGEEPEQIEGIAHKIKILASEIGSDRLKSAAFKVELAARRGDSNEIMQRITQLRQVCSTLKKTN